MYDLCDYGFTCTSVLHDGVKQDVDRFGYNDEQYQNIA